MLALRVAGPQSTGQGLALEAVDVEQCEEFRQRHNLNGSSKQAILGAAAMRTRLMRLINGKGDTPTGMIPGHFCWGIR